MVMSADTINAPARATSLPSVLVATMGPYPMQHQGTTTDALVRQMCENTTGYEVNQVVIPDMIDPALKSVESGEDLDTMTMGVGQGLMRSWAAFQAGYLGYDSLFLVENDTVMAPDTLSRLLRGTADVVIPHQVFPEWPPVYNVCWLPHAPLGATGYMDLEWCVFSAMLINKSGLSKVVPFFLGASGEGAEYERWASKGLSIQMDLDTTISVIKNPRGHKGYDSVPFEPHFKETRGGWAPCHGKMVEVARNKISDVWLCEDEETCGHVFTFRNTPKS